MTLRQSFAKEIFMASRSGPSPVAHKVVGAYNVWVDDYAVVSQSSQISF